jgi:hypothetical protein
MEPPDVGLVDRAAAVGLACTVLTFASVWSRLGDRKSDDVEVRRAVATALRACAAVVWPSLLLHSVCEQDRSNPVLLVPLLAHTAMWGVDSLLLNYLPSAQPEERPASLRFDPSSLTGISFGLCGLVGAKPDSRYSHLFVFAVVACLMAVLPSHNLEPGSLAEQVFESVQKSILMWCLSIVLAAVLLTRASACAS